MSSQGQKPPAPALLCQLVCESKIHKHMGQMRNPVHHMPCPQGDHRERFQFSSPSPTTPTQSYFLSGPCQGLPALRGCPKSGLFISSKSLRNHWATDLIRDPGPACESSLCLFHDVGCYFCFQSCVYSLPN